MTERMYLFGTDGQIQPLQEAAYESEAVLQALIAAHPEILAGEQMTPDVPRRWLLVSREMGISETADSGNRWAVDHLFLDQDAVPTLVEVKRASNPEIRRSIIGQMLEYAAHSRHWPVERIRSAFETSLLAQGREPGEAIANLVGLDAEPDIAAFWQKVATNLAAPRLRLVFVADEIPDPLARVVEFLNQHMPAVEVLAVELKQFQGGSLRTLVPHVIGRTARTTANGGSVPPVTREAFLLRFPEGAIREVARRFLSEVQSAGAVFEWGSRGVSIRGRTAAWSQPVTVAWLFPDDMGWMRTRYFSFGSGITDYPNLPSALRRLLLDYFESFRGESFVKDASREFMPGTWT